MKHGFPLRVISEKLAWQPMEKLYIHCHKSTYYYVKEVVQKSIYLIGTSCLKVW